MMTRPKYFYLSVYCLFIITTLITSAPAEATQLTKIAQTNTATPIIVQEISSTLQEQELYVKGPGFAENTFIIAGEEFSEFSVGDDLIVYSEIVPGTEVPTALLRVTARNPNSLTAQTVLVHPSRQIRPNLRVDGNITQLSTSELVPKIEIAIGYVLRPGRIRLLPATDSREGSFVEAMDPEIIDGAIVDYLPFSSPIKMQITNVGLQSIIASAELSTGDWPTPGTILIASSGISETIQLNNKAKASDPTGLPIVVHTEFWNELPDERGTSREWDDLPTEMALTIETLASVLYIDLYISRLQNLAGKRNTEFRLLVDGQEIGRTNTGGHFNWDFRSISFHGVAEVEAGTHDIRVEYRTQGGTLIWGADHNGMQFRRLTVLEIRK